MSSKLMYNFQGEGCVNLWSTLTVTPFWTVREMSLQLGVEIYVSDTADCVFDWISEDQDILIVFVWVKNRKSEEKTIWVYMTSLI